MALRNQKPSPNASWKYPVWKEKPPGPEQIELDRIFSQKEIDATATADSVHNSKEIFKKFSSSVFAAHFRATKAKFGLGDLKLELSIADFAFSTFFHYYSCVYSST